MKTTIRICIAWTIVLVLMESSGQAVVLEKLEQGENLSIVGIGTSLTAISPWLEQMGAWLNRKYPGQVTVYNEGISSAASKYNPPYYQPPAPGSGWDVQLPLALAHSPDAVFIEFAYNDADPSRHITPQMSQDNLQEMIDYIHGWGADNGKSVDIVVQVTNNCPITTSSYETYYQGYRDVATANANNGVLLVDNYSDWQNLYNTNATVWQSYVPDQVHPNSLGAHYVIVPNIKEALRNQVPGLDAGKITHELTGPEQTDDACILKGYPTWNDGVNQLVAGSAGNIRRSLVRFDLSALAGHTAESASLSVRVSMTSGLPEEGATVYVYQIAKANAGWVEGTGNESNAAEGENCWNYLAYSATDPAGWAGSAGLNTAGVDYLSTPLGSFTVTGTGAYLVTFSDLSFLQDWIDHPSDNAGFLLMSPDLEALNGNHYVRFGNGSNDSNVLNWPVLTVITEAPEPSSIVLLLCAGTLGLASYARSAWQR